MNNEDMTRFYDVGVDLGRPGDFVRRDKDGKVPGGLTLNKYTYTVPNSRSGIERAYRIVKNAKGGFNVFRKMDSYEYDSGVLLKAEQGYGSVQFSMLGGSTDVGTKQTNLEIISYLSSSTMYMNINIKADGTITVTADSTKQNMYLVYYNDTEIT